MFDVFANQRVYESGELDPLVCPLCAITPAFVLITCLTASGKGTQVFTVTQSTSIESTDMDRVSKEKEIWGGGGWWMEDMERNRTASGSKRKRTRDERVIYIKVLLQVAISDCLGIMISNTIFFIYFVLSAKAWFYVYFNNNLQVTLIYRTATGLICFRILMLFAIKLEKERRKMDKSKEPTMV